MVTVGETMVKIISMANHGAPSTNHGRKQGQPWSKLWITMIVPWSTMLASATLYIHGCPWLFMVNLGQSWSYFAGEA